jgi:hypothetical protein
MNCLELNCINGCDSCGGVDGRIGWLKFNKLSWVGCIWTGGWLEGPSVSITGRGTSVENELSVIMLNWVFNRNL